MKGFVIGLLTLFLSLILDSVNADCIAIKDASKNFAGEFKEKLNVNFSRACSVGEPFEKIQLYFEFYGDLSREQGRKLLLEVLNMSIAKINADQQLQKRLEKTPFTRDNLYITLFVNSPYPKRNDISIMGWNNKNFYYLLNRMIENYKEESYEKALQNR